MHTKTLVQNYKQHKTKEGNQNVPKCLQKLTKKASKWPKFVKFSTDSFIVKNRSVKKHKFMKIRKQQHIPSVFLNFIITPY